MREQRDAGRMASRRNLALVQRAYRLIADLQAARGEALDGAFGDYLDEGFELAPPTVYPEGAQVFRGREGLRRWIASTDEVWGEWRCETERLLATDDRVVAFVRLSARGSASGVPLDRDLAHVWTVRDGRLTRCEAYLDRSEALRAVGLESGAAMRAPEQSFDRPGPIAAAPGR
jgi:ketosteroid isomerase-like protein